MSSVTDMAHYRLGYARASTLQQDETLQHDALHAAGCDRIFVDTALRQAGVPLSAGRATRTGPAGRHARGLAPRPAGTVTTPPN